jgi:hypothetical protein
MTTILRRTALAVAAVGVLAACSSSTGTPNLVGSWAGSYTYPTVGGAANPSVMTLTITKQDGLLLYGYQEWGSGSDVQRADLVGSLSAESPTFVLTMGGGFFTGQVDGTTMVVRLVRTVEGSSTSFEASLTKQ